MVTDAMKTDSQRLGNGKKTFNYKQIIKKLFGIEDRVEELETVMESVITFETLEGLTISSRDNRDIAKMIYRTGNILVVNLDIFITGTYTGTSGWTKLFNIPATILKGKSYKTPYMLITPGNQYILNGQLVTLTSGQTYNMTLNAQIIFVLTDGGN